MPTSQLTIFPYQPIGRAIPARVFGNFLEHLGYALDGGILAYALANPTFERDSNLRPDQVNTLLQNGKILTNFYLQGCDPETIPENWSPGIGATGFGVCALDDARAENVPFPWAPLGAPGAVSPAVGRIGGAVRLRAAAATQPLQVGGQVALDDGPTGIRQGIFLPFQRCLSYQGHLWARSSAASGQIEVGLRRRVRRAGQTTPVGECLAVAICATQGQAWQKIAFDLILTTGQVQLSEPVDFFIRWLPDGPGDLLLDRAILAPSDAVAGCFDPDVLRAVKEWGVPLLRWPGGNFASGYHWRDGIGPFDRRPTRPNLAWGGLESNFFGTGEFLRFCRLSGAEPHITVNTATGTPEEAADWLEFCNGAQNTRMGALRGGEPQPVQLWEVGNEVYGSWQQGYHGGDENALRFGDFARVMRQVDPTIELIGTGNQFDIAAENPALDHTAADQAWNRAVIAGHSQDLDYLSLHCLPANDLFLHKLTPAQAYYSLVAQPQSWEQEFIPAIQAMFQQAASQRGPGRAPSRLAITEWGVLGPRAATHPVVENYGEVIYAGVFLNLCVRNHTLIPIANATGLLHGGCIRKAAGQVFHDPQYPLLQRYTRLSGQKVLQLELTSPVYAAPVAPDLGLPLQEVPYLDAVACIEESSGTISIAIVNRHLEQTLPVTLLVQGGWEPGVITCEQLVCPDFTSRAKLGQQGQFDWQPAPLSQDRAGIHASLPGLSVSWITITRPSQ